ncbi:CGNR zinc finger domain-containing protein [Frateuria hangzhouensis]|uniref:CGNR zinc finger domain-containing protein n=1 Tax=Frateuria hangzhouensis TaxID=2995589 RepID=UPI002260A9C7|nr:ABATE domain-containing protein [Frateuria sp. STR12]MCX7514664.1 ABATE domain-containing protein [Frateuria sp. STR12]
MSPTHPPSTPRSVAAARLDGGRLCLDFVNTIHDRYAVDVEDYVQDAQRFIAWSERAGALGPGDGVHAPRAVHARAALMREVVALRECLHALFAARIDGLSPPAEAVRGLDRWLHEAWASQALGADGQMHWRADARDARLPLKRIALDALDLLGGPNVSRLRRCANTTSCGWLFLDTTKNGRRRWCAMETCGTAEKMQRYRRR